MIREFLGLGGHSSTSRNFRGTLENPQVALTSANAATLFSGGSGCSTSAGVHVDELKSLAVPAVMQCVATISGDCGVATRNVYDNNDDDPKIDWEHTLQNILAVAPNEECSSFEFWSRTVLHACLWGNGYAHIRRAERDGPITELYNMLPDRTKPIRDPKSGKLMYVSEIGGRPEFFDKEEILHIKNISVELMVGLPIIQTVRDTIGLILAAEGFSSKFFANGAQSGGILEIPTAMTKMAADNLEEGFKKRTGPDNWFRTVILRDGAKFHQTTIDAQKSQTIELREEQVKEIARIFRLPTSKLGIADSVSYNSQEQDQLSYLNSTLNHWFSAIEGECELKLLSPEERFGRKKYIEHNKTKLVEMDQTTLNAVLSIQRQNSVINANEWRRKINLPKRTDEKGDDYENPNTTAGGEDHNGPTKPRGKEKKGPKKPSVRK